MTKPIRRKVVSGYLSGPFWGNSYQVIASCGHSIIAQGFKRAIPKTTRCYLCEKEAVKLQAVPGNESVQLQPVAAPRELRLLCLLGKRPDGQAQATPVRTLRPMPPRVCPTWPHPKHGPRRWCLDALEVGTGNNACLSLRQAHPKRPTTQAATLLGGSGEHRQAGALCADSRTIRADRVIV